MSRTLGRFVLLIVGVVGMAVGMSGQTSSRPGGKNVEWRHYAADIRQTRFSPADEITASNFNQLEVAWRFKTDNLGTRPEYKLEGTPLEVNGVVYTTGGTRRAVVALDAKTGEQLWVHRYPEGKRSAMAPRQLSGRGVAYWTDGRGDERILYVTTGYRLIALNAKTGSMIQSFGQGGVVDLKMGAVVGKGQQIDLETGEIGVHSTPTVVKDMVIVGSSMKEGMTVVTHNNTKGLVRAFDVKTGKQIWKFNTIPGPGEFGNETWENESWAVNGNTGVWSQIAVDEELGLVYLPVETPTSDFYGGHRPGANLFGETLVCVDLQTGKRKWHYQMVHHPIWNYDHLTPILADISVDGRAIKAIVVPTKIGWLYVFDRVTGQPVWPIEERPVPPSDVPGEKTSPTQPHPTKPAPYAHLFFKVPDDVIDFTPALREQALQVLKRYKISSSPFDPPILGSVDGILGLFDRGDAVSWPGSAYDPETHTFYAQSSETAGSRSIAPMPPGFSDIQYGSGIAKQPFVEARAAGTGTNADNAPPPRTAPAPGGGGGGGGLNVQGLPLTKPPYGTLTAISLDRGEILWQVPHGDTPDAVRDHPALKGLNIPKTGQNGTCCIGLAITKTLVIMGDPQYTAPPGRPRGAMLRAYDKRTGQEVGAVWMPAPSQGSPMTYMVDGKQYIVAGISGGNYSGEYIAFSLP